MTAVMRAAAPRPHGPRWLRFAVVLDGRVVSEQVVSPERVVTVGSDAGVDVLSRDVDGCHDLLRYRDDAWILRRAPSFTGRSSEGPIGATDGEVAPDGWREIVLSSDGRARLEVGGAAVLVQVVDRPPTRHRPALPAALTGGLLDSVDWWFTSFVTASFCMHFVLAAFVLEADWEIERGLVPTRFVEVIFTPPEPPDAIEMPMSPDASSTSLAQNDAESPAETDATPADAPRRNAPPTRAPRHDGAPSLSSDDQQAIEAAHQLIGAILAGSAMTNLLADGAASEDQASLMAEVDAPSIAATGDVGRMAERTRASGEGCDGPCRDLMRGLRRTGPGPASLTEGVPLVETVIVIPPSRLPEFDPGPTTFDPRELLQRLRARMPRVRACYEREMTQGNPDLSGRITLSMRVMPVGSLAGVTAEDNTTGSSSLAACAIRALDGVRVTGPESPVEIRYPIVFARQE